MRGGGRQRRRADPLAAAACSRAGIERCQDRCLLDMKEPTEEGQTHDRKQMGQSGVQCLSMARELLRDRGTTTDIPDHRHWERQAWRRQKREGLRERTGRVPAESILGF